jgi:hypothetical protein
MGMNEKDPLHPLGGLDVLDYYSTVAHPLTRFLKGKELATKVWIPNGPKLLKRGSDLEPLSIQELASPPGEAFLRLRNESSLPEAREGLSPLQEKLWQYFFPRKLCDLFYATNGEGAGRPIERLFFDIDRGGPSAEEAAMVAAALLGRLSDDKDFASLVGKGTAFVLWTGNSFHVYYLLRQPVPNSVYDQHVQFSKNSPQDSFTGRWVSQIAKETGLKMAGGHEKREGFLILDPSQTPSGKLARAPFSLHMKDSKSVDGVALPVPPSGLGEKGLVRELQSYTPERVLDGLAALGKLIP